jgi:hypothetical protein
MGEVFTRKLREMDAKAKRRSAEASQVVLRTSLGAQHLRRLTRAEGCHPECAERNLLGGDPRKVRNGARMASAASNSLCGGQKVAWSIADYLSSLRIGKVGELLDAQSAHDAIDSVQTALAEAPAAESLAWQNERNLRCILQTRLTAPLRSCQGHAKRYAPIRAP